MNRSTGSRGTKQGTNTSSEEGRVAQISVMADNKVNGPEDSVVSEMIQLLPSEKLT